jgi:hypothetical protein
MADNVENIALSEDILSKRLATGTKYQYNSKIKSLLKWIQSSHQDLYDEENDKLRLDQFDDKLMMDFMGFVCRKRKRNSDEYVDPPQFFSFSYVSSYRSAIKDLYKQENIEVPRSVANFLNQFNEGYTRMVAMKKQTGETALVEGSDQFLLASIVYHADYLEHVLLPYHPLFSTRLWTENYAKSLRNRVLDGVIENSQSRLAATGNVDYITICYITQ